MTSVLQEVRRSVEAGAAEIDIVISRSQVLTGDWRGLYDEVRAFRAACGPAHMKAIVAAGDLGTLRNLALASQVCMMAASDFIKTSTGEEPVNATLPYGLVMVRASASTRSAPATRWALSPRAGSARRSRRSTGCCS